ncbi:MAG: YncE family protein [Comamonadaceae bacterium]|nr:MAG: YncE family protein [Comamonadaceae bacterium]
MHFAPRLATVAVLAATLTLAACQSVPTPGASATSTASSTTIAVRQDAFKGVYEVIHSPAQGSVFVASTPAFEAGTPGFVYRLDANDLSLKQTLQTPLRAFALGLNRATGTLYVGNTLDGSLTVIDAASGAVRQVIQLAQKDAEGKVPHTRKVIVDEKRNRVFVTSPGMQGKVWIVDGARGVLLHTLDNTGTWTAGAAFDDVTNRLYVSQGGTDEVLEIDPDAGRVLRKFSTGDTKVVPTKPDESKHFFVNLALDTRSQRLFAADPSTDQLYVFDIRTGQVLRTIPVGKGLLDVVFNPVPNEVYTTHRGVSRSEPDGVGAVTLIDAASLTVRRSVSLPVHPNSLAITPEGQTLYVTVKSPRDKHPAFVKGGNDSVVKIDLR